MPKRIPYEHLALMPCVVAHTIATETYKGQEISLKLRSSDQVEKTEAARKLMTDVQREEFASIADELCRQAYAAKSDWFQKCIRRSKTNVGRDHLYMWVRHWLASYLHDPNHLRRQVPNLELRRKLNPARFPNMSGKMVALVGCILGQQFTDPSIAEITVSSDGFMLARNSNDIGFNEFIGAASDFESNWNRLLDVAHLTDEERKLAQSLKVAAIKSH